MRRGGTATGTAETGTATAGAGRQLGRYRLLDVIGREDDARLHRAQDASGREVALWTVPLVRLRADGAGLERFRQMASATARLSHPAIPTILASGEHAGIAFVATAPAEGPTLATRLAGSPLAWEEAVATLDRVLDALATAHRAGVVHGALSADKVLHAGSAAMLTGFGRAALSVARTDRGDDLAAAARLTERLLAGHEGQPGVAALRTELRDRGVDSFPDARSLHRAVAGLGRMPFPPSAALPARSRRRPLWVGGIVLAGGLAAVAIQNRASPPPPAATAAQALAETTPEPTPAPPAETTAPSQPPFTAVMQALRSIPCALVTVETMGGRLLVSGTVAGERAETEVREAVEANAAGWDHGFDLAVADARSCAPLASVGAALDANRGVAEPLATSVLDGPALNAGAPLVLEIRAPAHPVRLQVDYFTIDGTVVHLLPNPSEDGAALAAGAARLLGEKGEDGKPETGRHWTIGPPYGTEMLLTIATGAPLFPAPRPEQEPADDYLAALAKALATIPGNAPAPLADAHFIATGP
ncbi:serine/threonine protein kinase [Azospirillum sp. 412522]|nr:serine/threonine protein kinase [Azospirillum sp. 412522]MBY6264558.1 serine/threonine protein kinase [Azospirillum sp. 412522]